MEEMVDRLISECSKENYEVLVKIISNLTFVSSKKDNMLANLELNTITYNDNENLKKFIDKILLSNVDDFKLYTRLVRIAINLKDGEKIKKTIDKIQSLGV
jgi:hypothetical protein